MKKFMGTIDTLRSDESCGPYQADKPETLNWVFCLCDTMCCPDEHCELDGTPEVDRELEGQLRFQMLELSTGEPGIFISGGFVVGHDKVDYGDENPDEEWGEECVVWFWGIMPEERHDGDDVGEEEGEWLGEGARLGVCWGGHGGGRLLSLLWRLWYVVVVVQYWAGG